MKIIEDLYRIEHFSSRVFDEYFSERSMVVFDIETMGLDAGYSPVILAAFLDVDKSGDGHFKQFFIEDYSEEPELVSMIINELEKYDIILTYNGNHFDLPYISKRNKYYGFETYEPSGFSLDLYQVIQKASEIKKTTGSLSQKSIEKYLGLDHLRDDEISGADSVEMFKQYLETNDIEFKKDLGRKILLHNHDDVLQLYRILRVIRQVDFHKAMFKLGFNIAGENGWPTLKVKDINISKSSLTASGVHFGAQKTYYSFPTDDFPFESEFRSDNTFSISIPVEYIKNSIFVNTSLIDSGCTFDDLPGYAGGYLVLKEGKEINYHETNRITKQILVSFMRSITF